MDFKDNIEQVSERVAKMKENLHTEEATKNALIMPFITALGYDVFNPLEVVPEMICDIGTKKGEKIDYAILLNEVPAILIECKHWEEDLDKHDIQLLRYYNTSEAKFGILTNGIIYRFYTDLAAPNVMDSKPFLEINLEDLKDTQIAELKKFHKSYFNIDTIFSSASELKFTGELKAVILKEFANPSLGLVKLLGKQIYDGQFTSKIADQFTPLIKKSINSYINDIISDRLKAALQDGQKEENPEMNTDDLEEIGEMSTKKRIVTTEQELEAFYLIKSILRENIPAERITYRDARSYFAIFMDQNNRKPICHLYLDNPKHRRIGIYNEDKNEILFDIASIEDIYSFSDQLKISCDKYLE